MSATLATVGLRPTNIVPLIPQNTGSRFLGSVRPTIDAGFNASDYQFALLAYDSQGAEIKYCGIPEYGNATGTLDLSADPVGGSDTVQPDYDITITSASSGNYDLKRPASLINVAYYQLALFFQAGTAASVLNSTTKYSTSNGVIVLSGTDFPGTSFPVVSNGFISGAAGAPQQILVVKVTKSGSTSFFRVWSTSASNGSTSVTLEASLATTTSNGLVVPPDFSGPASIAMYQYNVLWATDSSKNVEKYTPGLNNLVYEIYQPAVSTAKISFPKTTVSASQANVYSYPSMGTKLFSVSVLSTSAQNNVCVIWDTPPKNDPLVVRVSDPTLTNPPVVEGMVPYKSFDIFWNDTITSDTAYTGMHVVITDSNGLTVQIDVANIKRYAADPTFTLSVAAGLITGLTAAASHATVPINVTDKAWYLANGVASNTAVASLTTSSQTLNLSLLPSSYPFQVDNSKSALVRTSTVAAKLLRSDLLHTENGVQFYVLNNLDALSANKTFYTTFLSAFTGTALTDYINLKPYTKASATATWKLTNGTSLTTATSSTFGISDYSTWALNPSAKNYICARLDTTDGTSSDNFVWNLSSPPGLQFNLGTTYTKLQYTNSPYIMPNGGFLATTLSVAPTAGIWNSSDVATQLYFNFRDNGTMDEVLAFRPADSITFVGTMEGKEIGTPIPNPTPDQAYLRNPAEWMSKNPRFNITCTGQGAKFGNLKYPNLTATPTPNAPGTGVQWVFIEMKSNLIKANDVILRMSDLCSAGLISTATTPTVGFRMTLSKGSRNVYTGTSSDGKDTPFQIGAATQPVIVSSAATGNGLLNAGEVCLFATSDITIDETTFNNYSGIYTVNIFDGSDDVANTTPRLSGEVGFVFWKRATATVTGPTPSQTNDIRLIGYTAPDIAFTDANVTTKKFTDVTLDFSYTGYAYPTLQATNLYATRPTLNVTLVKTDASLKDVSLTLTPKSDSTTTAFSYTMSAQILSTDPDMRYSVSAVSAQNVYFSFPANSINLATGTTSSAPSTYLLQTQGDVLSTPVTVTLITGFNTVYGNESDKIVVNENLDSILSTNNNFVSYVASDNTFFDLSFGQTSVANPRWATLSMEQTKVALIQVNSFTPTGGAPLYTAKYTDLKSAASGLQYSLDSTTTANATGSALVLSAKTGAANALKIVTTDVIVPSNPYYILLRVSPEGVCRYRKLQWVADHEIANLAITANRDAWYPDSYAVNVTVGTVYPQGNPHQPLWWQLERREETPGVTPDKNTNAWEIARSARDYMSLSQIAAPAAGDKPRVIEGFLTGLPERRYSGTVAGNFFEYRLSAYQYSATSPNPLPLVRSNILAVSNSRPTTNFTAKTETSGLRSVVSANTAATPATYSNYQFQIQESGLTMIFSTTNNTLKPNVREARVSDTAAQYDTLLPSDDVVNVSALDTADATVADYTIELPPVALFPVGKVITVNPIQPTSSGFPKYVSLVPRAASGDKIHAGSTVSASYSTKTSVKVTVKSGKNATSGLTEPYWDVSSA